MYGLTGTIACEEDVLRLEIAVNQAALVHILDRRDHRADVHLRGMSEQQRISK